MSNERIDLEYLLEEDSLLQDLNWSIARFEQVEKLVKEMTAELKKLYEFMDLHQICGCGAICPNMNKETWARVKRCGFCESAE